MDDCSHHASIAEVTPPNRRNNFTGGLTIDDPQNGGDIYEVVLAWRNPAPLAAPLAANDPYPYYDETRACQDRVRREFLSRTRRLSRASVPSDAHANMCS